MLTIFILDDNGEQISTVKDKEATYNHKLNVFEVRDEDGLTQFTDVFSYLDDVKGRFVG